MQQKGDQGGWSKCFEVFAFLVSRLVVPEGGGRCTSSMLMPCPATLPSRIVLCSRSMTQSLQNQSRSTCCRNSCLIGGSWQYWCQGELQPSQKTIALDAGLWPRPQFRHTAEAPGIRFAIFLSGLLAALVAEEGTGRVPLLWVRFGAGEGCGSEGSSSVSNLKLGLLCAAWIILRPERDCEGKVVISSLDEPLS